MDVDEQVDPLVPERIAELGLPNELSRPRAQAELLGSLVDERAPSRACRRRREHRDELGRPREGEEPADDLDPGRLFRGDDDP
jgi:hypothetical protein